MFEKINRKTYFENWDNHLIDMELEYMMTVGGRRWWILVLLAEKQFRMLEMEGI